MKFLIIRFSSIGDIVLTSPVVRCLRKTYPNAIIHFLVKPQFKVVVESSPYIDKVHLLSDDVKATIAELQKENFTTVIDLHHNLRTLKLKAGLKDIPTFSFNKLNIEKYLLTAFKINRMPKVNIVDRNLDTLKALKVEDDGEGMDYFIPEKDVTKNDDIPAPHRVGFVGIVIGASLATKQMPVEKLREVCAAINYPIVLLGGPEDTANGDAIAEVDPVKIYNACGKFNLNESADLVRRAKLIVAHDTGLMHMAAALRKRVISVWGSTAPVFGMVPFYGKHKIQNDYVEVEDLACRPCSKIGYKKCPKGHFKCMKLIPTERIVNLVHQYLEI